MVKGGRGGRKWWRGGRGGRKWWRGGRKWWSSSQSAKWQTWRFQMQDFLMILFLCNYLILYMSDWSVHFFIWKCTPDPENLIQYHQLVRVEGLLHLLQFLHWKQPNFPFWTLILDPEITTHECRPSSMFSSDFPLFHCNVSFRNALLSIFGNVNSIPQHHQPPFLSFSMIFPLLYCYSSISIATPSVFGNAHRILKTAPQTSSSTVSTITLCFCNFPLFYCFSFNIAMLSIFGNVQCTLKALPNIITNSGHHPLFFPVQFPPFYCYFSFAEVPISIFGGAHWTLETVPNVVTNSEHQYQAHQCTGAQKWQVFGWN